VHKPKKSQRARSLKLRAEATTPAGASWAPAATDPKLVKKMRLLEDTSERRKQFPVTTGLLDYFPDACAAISEISFVGNMKHNPGEPMHHARGKSSDHADCIGRHLLERGGFEMVTVGGKTYKMRHSAALAWRACAHLQEELENEYGFPLPRGAKAAK
jgi:hypothetical protein